jgi:hypothetical protein
MTDFPRWKPEIIIDRHTKERAMCDADKDRQIADLQELVQAWRDYNNLYPSIPGDRARKYLLEKGELGPPNHKPASI